MSDFGAQPRLLSWDAGPDALRDRANLLAELRTFFAEREVMEVQTPALMPHTVTDPYIASWSTSYQPTATDAPRSFFLQTSPEYAMKRLLAKGSGDIYQLAKAFRQDPSGRLHTPEFTMLEWYRVGWDHERLMQEVDELLQHILKTPPADQISYGDLFEQAFGIDPHSCTLDAARKLVKAQGIAINPVHISDVTTALDLLFSHRIEPDLAQDRPCMVKDYPVAQAALAKIRSGNPPVAERFEVYYRGVELANGFHELQDAGEQRRRFEQDNQVRQQMGLPEIALDENFLKALEQGLPACAGVALGVDRLQALMA